MTERWTAARKAQVVQRMLAGELGMLEAIEKYDMSWDELREWMDRFAEYGVKGLRTTKLLNYRRSTRTRPRR